MNWQDKPTAPGFHWAYFEATDLTVPVRIDHHAQLGLQIVAFDVAGSVSPNSGDWRSAKWFGPLQPPMPPRLTQKVVAPPEANVIPGRLMDAVYKPVKPPR